MTAFVGPATRGPLGTPVLVHSLDDYERTYGAISSEQDAMGFAALAYYQNGGKDAYIVRVADPTGAQAAFATLGSDADTPEPLLTLSATSEGEWGNDIYFRVTRPTSFSTAAPVFTLEVGHLELVEGVSEFKADATFSNLSMNESAPTYALGLVDGSAGTVKLEFVNDTTAEDLAGHGTLVGAAIASPVAGDRFSSLPEKLSLSVNIDGLGAKTLSFTKTSLKLGGTNGDADAALVAKAVQDAIQQIAPSEEPFQGVTCTYDAATHRFTLRSPASASSSVEIYDSGAGPSLAKAMRLEPASTPTRVHGSLPLVPAAVEPTKLTSGAAEPPRAQDYQSVFGGPLKKISDISVVVLPDQSLPPDGTGNPGIAAALAHCEEMRNRVLIIDPPPGFELKSAQEVNQLRLPTSTYSVLYYPRVKVANPFYKAGATVKASPTVTVAPSAFAAGMWSRIDARRGVWKAPAGVETSLLGTAGLEFQVDDGAQDQLNPLGVNCLRVLPNFGAVLWGARTLATRADPEWRYVSVRRTAIMIEQSVYNGIQWAVFEPNDHRLWSALRTNIGSFMDGLFRAGAFQGDKASDAYFVRCGLGDTMTQGDIDRGQVIAVVGFAPLKAAEFVIIRIQQKLQQ
ncbi:phage tail sheath family protein [Cystobacter fuscus]|uniref:phage tail sheath family protein n=1 Tax=Cystobacter fuscus TaxID=43 RepID=UPI0018E0120E|nr:phage tail sheath C-terminal domain-containing protein [Cystobacter fuscus]